MWLGKQNVCVCIVCNVSCNVDTMSKWQNRPYSAMARVPMGLHWSCCSATHLQSKLAFQNDISGLSLTSLVPRLLVDDQLTAYTNWYAHYMTLHIANDN